MKLDFLRRNRELKHEEAWDRLSAYLDETLSTREASAVERHLEHCHACAGELQTLQLTRQLLRSLPVVRAPRSFTLAAAPVTAPAPLPRGFFVMRNATGLAAAALAVLLFLPAMLPVAGVTPSQAPAAVSSQAERSAPAGAEPAAQEAPAAAGPAAEATPAGDSEVRPFGAPAAQPEPAAAPRAPALDSPEPLRATEPAAQAPAAAPAARAPASEPAGPPAAASAPTTGEGAQPSDPAGVAATQAAPQDSKAASPEDQPVSSPAVRGQPSASPTAGEQPATPLGLDPEPSEEPALSRQVEAAPTSASERATGDGMSTLMALQGLAGGLVALLSLATGAIWWRHHARYR